jgi:hypothetical protein
MIETTPRVASPDVDTAGEKPADSVILAEIQATFSAHAAHSCPHSSHFVGGSPEWGASHASGK